MTPTVKPLVMPQTEFPIKFNPLHTGADDTPYKPRIKYYQTRKDEAERTIRKGQKYVPKGTDR